MSSDDLGFRVVTLVDWEESPEEHLKASAKAQQRKAAESLGLEVTHENSLGMHFRLIGAGQVSIEPDVGPENSKTDERPRVLKIEQPYYLCETETAVRQFRRFIQATNHQTTAEETPGSALRAQSNGKIAPSDVTWREPGYPLQNDLPVTMVSRLDCEKFCEWLSETEGRRYRLPTNVEWEYACRAGTGTPHFFTPREQLNDYAHTVPRTGFAPHPVAQRKPNPWGLFDVYGNVMEWCQPTSMPADDSVSDTAKDQSVEIVCGGGWWQQRDSLRSSAGMTTKKANTTADALGFRVLLEIDAAK